MNIGQMIKQRRLSMGSTLEQIASAANLDVSNLSRIERGKQEPSEGVVRRIAAALQVTMAQLYTDPDSGDKTFSVNERPAQSYGKQAQTLVRSFQALDQENQQLLVDFSKLLERRQRKQK